MHYYKKGESLTCTIGKINLPEITKEEYETEMAAVNKRMEVQESIAEAHRPFTESEVLALLIPQQINTLSVDDNTALRMKDFYPEWAAGVEYSAGFKVKHGGKLWRTIQAHTSQAGWEPESAASLWEQINETHAGTLEDPIPYDGNMALEAGKHYMQNWEIYLCTRDTVNPVFNPLKELTGIYVGKA